MSSFRYAFLAGLVTLSLAAQAPPPQTEQERRDRGSRPTSDRSDTTDRNQSGRTGSQSGDPAGRNNQSGNAQSDRNSSTAGGAFSASDKKFVMKAAQGGKMEVELGNLAMQNASSDAVKQFAQRMVNDHGKANEELASMASQKGVTLPTDVASDGKKMHDRLSKMQGAAFDKAYMQHMVKDHQKDVAEFEKQSNSGSDPDLKAWASKTLPKLREHLEQARSISQTVSSGGGASSSTSDRNTGGDQTQSSSDPSGRKGKQ